MVSRSSSRSTARGLVALLSLAAMFVALVAPPLAFARSDAELEGMKTYWQNRYRQLLVSADDLREEIERETGLYADANRRNYRRGTKRHVHRVAIEEAEKKLAEVNRELSTIKEEGRRAGALPAWFYDVEQVRADAARNPALAPRPDDPDRGRNPKFAPPGETAPASAN